MVHSPSDSAATGTAVPEARSQQTGGELAIELVRQCWVNRPLDCEEQAQLQSVSNFSQLVPALPLICHELYMSAREMSFLHAPDADPPEKLAFNADPATEYTHSGSRLCNSTRTRCCALTRKRARSRTW